LTIWPRAKKPRSPPRDFEPGVLRDLLRDLLERLAALDPLGRGLDLAARALELGVRRAARRPSAGLWRACTRSGRL
jgi:hypothetical protein